MRHLLHLFAAVATVTLIAVLGCQTPVAETSVPGTIGPATPIDLGTGPERPRRRMDIEQLDAAMRRATGGIGWDDSAGNSQLVRFRSTLGVPDYVGTTNEDREVSALFLKFLDDAARSSCDRLIEREEDAMPADRVFLVHADLESVLPDDREAIDRNLAHLLLRFHGRRVEPGSPELAPWHELFADSRAMSADAPKIAWRTVCVALFDHPDFYLY